MSEPRRRTALGLGLGLLAAAAVASWPGTADGSAAEARDAARTAGCRPKSLTPIRQIAGPASETTYEVSCAEPKESTLLVQCRMHLCVVLR